MVDKKIIDGLIEVGKRNIKNAIFRFEKTEGLDYRDFNVENIDYCKNIACMWTSGKDSSIALWLVRELFNGRVPMDVVFIDTGYHFKEVYEYRDKIAEEWGLNLVIGRNDTVLDMFKKDEKVYIDDLPEEMQKIARESGWTRDYFKVGENPVCCTLLKTYPFLETIKKKGYKAVIENVRWDEQRERNKVNYFTKGSGWVEHYRVRPVPYMTFEEVKFLRDGNFGVPKNPLYDKGYQSLGCYPCTKPVGKDAAERAGRDAQKEEMMARLQALGYHGGEEK
ncbi:hypothetical protein DRN50_05100 [Thermococci archaeon]|nr:MAG: hypothetical protein DRN50_05100 [Thermococci archaeon]